MPNHFENFHGTEMDNYHGANYVENSGSGGNGGCGNASGGAPTSSGGWAVEATQPGFLSPSAVSAAAAAMGLSPTHLAYSLNHDSYHHVQV